MGTPSRNSAPLTPQGAFVVHFYTDTNITAGCLAGRVEHVVSGRSVRFSSMAGLLAFIGKILGEVNAGRQGGISLDVMPGGLGPSPASTA
jgi:hypothetical protein